MRHFRLLRKWQLYSVLSAMLIMVMMVVACGGDEAAPAPAAQPKATATPTSPPAPKPTATTSAAGAKARPTATARAKEPTPTPPPPAEPVQARLRVAMSPPGTQSSVHWKLAGWQSAQGPLYSLYDTLLHINRFTEEWDPYLAESWEMSSDAKDWHFNLRKGVPFYQNKKATKYEVVAEDVIHSYMINFFPPHQAAVPSLGQFSDSPDDFEVINDHEFIWHLNGPSLTWAYWVTDDRRGVASKAYWDDVGEEAYIEDPIGAGPFTYVDFKMNEGLLVERVEDHYRKTPEFLELEYFYVPEDATRLAMLLANEADISGIPIALHDEATQRGYEIVSSTTPGFYTFMFIGGMYDATKPDGYNKMIPGFEVDEESPMRIKDVREAINLAINREELNKVFFNDGATMTTRWAFPPARGNYDPNWAPYPYDPEKAKQLIIDAGYPNGFEIEVLTPGSLTGLPQAGDMSETIAQYFEQIGLQPKIIPVNTAQMSSIPRNRELHRGVVITRFGVPGKGDFVRHARNNIGYRQEWQMFPEIFDFVSKLEGAESWDTLNTVEVEAANWIQDHHLFIPLFWVFPQVASNPNVVAKYESRHLHMGPSRHHEYTVPVMK